jgi:hypothetical protein
MNALERLPFVLPDFTRITWTSDRARAVWEPRLRRISRAWAHVEWLSIAGGVRRACLTRMSTAQFHATAPMWARHHVSAIGLAREGAGRFGYSSTASGPAAGRPPLVCIGLATVADLAALKRAWDAHDDQRLGELLGYPACCRAFFRRVWAEGAYVDTTWHMALGTAGAMRTDGQIEVGGPEPGNTLCRWIGVRSVPHLPLQLHLRRDDGLRRGAA